VSRIDPTTRQVMQTIPIGPGPVTPVSELGIWIAASLGDRLVRLDPASGAVLADVAVGDGPLTPVVGIDSLWVPLHGGIVARVDVETNRVTHRLEVGGRPETPANVGGAIWVPTGATLRRIDPFRREVTHAVELDTMPSAPAFAASLVWTSVQGAALGLAPRTATVEARIDFDPGAAGTGDVFYADRALWVTDIGGGKLRRFDLDALVLTDTITVGGWPMPPVLAADAIWVANSKENTVSRIALAPFE
jgi:DNA-binding beta-propeller fold protein YncE